MTTALDVLTFNLNNPGRERAERQLAYLAARPEPVLVLTETADSGGCELLATRFESAGYSVTFPRPGRGERGVMIVSRLATAPGPAETEYLPHRCVSVTVDTDKGPLDVIGLYVPSRDATDAKTTRKRTFLEECQHRLPAGWGGPLRVVIGDFNILEPTHTPRYRFFQPFEYAFYEALRAAGYEDAFRRLHPEELEYSWVGRTGDGYRYDHAHVSQALANTLHACAYVHDVRTAGDRLTDHSALSVSLGVRPTEPLAVTAYEAAEAAAALF
ncbi:endonuclease/exonuclease/phosphatase family protein [Streptomyces sp. NPDC019990]|uniref:endonuclease/exonuclease/phosphatase family protein n=1 Tax=Streptomyces sp. NPDC019990 TaxID=3154693 RepID=UPI0033E8A5DB